MSLGKVAVGEWTVAVLARRAGLIQEWVGELKSHPVGNRSYPEGCSGKGEALESRRW